MMLPKLFTELSNKEEPNEANKMDDIVSQYVFEPKIDERQCFCANFFFLPVWHYSINLIHYIIEQCVLHKLKKLIERLVNKTKKFDEAVTKHSLTYYIL